MSSTTLRDACERIDYGLTASARPDGGGPRFLRITDIDQSHVDWTTVPRCDATPQEVEKYSLRTGDIVVARTGASTGRSQWVQLSEPAVFASYLVRFRVRSNVSSRFLGFVLQSRRWHRYINANAHSKSAQPNLSAARMAEFEFECPDLRTQRAIAEVLGALDDKIAANTNSVAIAEDLLTASYAATLKESPSEITVAEIAQFHNRKRVPLSSRERGSRPGSVPYYGATGVFGFVDEALFDEPLVLVGEDGSVVTAAGHPVVQYIWGPAWVNNHAHVLTGIGISTELLKVALARSNVAPIVTGAVQPKISMGNLKRLPVLIPRPELRAGLEEKAARLTALLRSKTDEQKKLASTRDVLLPALMSGKVRVKDAERVVEEVV